MKDGAVNLGGFFTTFLFFFCLFSYYVLNQPNESSPGIFPGFFSPQRSLFSSPAALHRAADLKLTFWLLNSLLTFGFGRYSLTMAKMDGSTERSVKTLRLARGHFSLFDLTLGC